MAVPFGVNRRDHAPPMNSRRPFTSSTGVPLGEHVNRMSDFAGTHRPDDPGRANSVTVTPPRWITRGQLTAAGEGGGEGAVVTAVVGAGLVVMDVVGVGTGTGSAEVVARGAAGWHAAESNATSRATSAIERLGTCVGRRVRAPSVERPVELRASDVQRWPSSNPIENSRSRSWRE
jgi:hypothetical protein